MFSTAFQKYTSSRKPITIRLTYEISQMQDFQSSSFATLLIF